MIDGDIFRAIVLGIIQGLTEFLPISSSAHLIIVPWLFGWEPFGLGFDASIHLGTLMAVIAYFRHDLWAIARGVLGSWRGLLRGRMPDDPMGRLGLYFVVASLPAGLVGLLLEGAIDRYFHNDDLSSTVIVLIAIMLMIMGVLLGLADRYGRHDARRQDLEQLTFSDALIVGCAQALALFPGVSRSGSTITAGLFAGMTRATAARFSFLLGVPIVLGAGSMEVLDLARAGLPAEERDIFIAGIVSAGLVGYAAIAGLLRFLARRPVDVFVAYRIVLGVALLVLVAAGFRS